jgi:hypothetical protein
MTRTPRGRACEQAGRRRVQVIPSIGGSLLRSALVRPLALVATLALGACATSQGSAGAPSPTAAATSAEDEAYAARAMRLRSAIIARSSWAEMGEGCNPGEMRTFMDTTKAAMGGLDSLVRELERVVVARGVMNPIDTPAGRDLLRTIVLWEAAGPRPRWDTDEPKERRALATGLTGLVYNPQTRKCESYVDEESVVVILPEGITLPKLSAKNAMEIVAYTGDSSIARARNEYFATAGRAAGDTFGYTRIGPVVLWREWGLVAVNRPLEIRNGGEVTQTTAAGGATYLFRRVGGEWRLFMIVRTWA